MKKVDYKVIDLDILTEDLAILVVGIETKNNKAKESKSKERNDCRKEMNFTFKSFVTKDLFMLSNIDITEDWRKVQEKQNSIENKFNSNSIKVQVKGKYSEIFSLITFNL